MIPIDDQIKYQQGCVDTLANCRLDVTQEKAILASLEELKRIREVQVPEEPESVQYLRECVVARTRGESTLQYIDTLRDLLKQCKHNSSVTMDELGEMRDRAEAAETKLAAIDAVQVPVEPEQIKMMRYDEPEGRSDYERAITDYIDSLQSALQVAQQERDDAERMVKNLAPTGRYNGLDIEQWMQRAKKAEAERNDWENKAGHHPQSLGRRDELCQCLPPLCGRILVCVSLVDNDQVKPGLIDLRSYCLDPIKVDDYEFIFAFDDLLTFRYRAMCDTD